MSTSTRTSQCVRSYVHPLGAKFLAPMHLPPRSATHEMEHCVYCCASTGGDIAVRLGAGRYPFLPGACRTHPRLPPARLASGPRSFPALKAPDNLLPSNFQLLTSPPSPSTNFNTEAKRVRKLASSHMVRKPFTTCTCDRHPRRSQPKHPQRAFRLAPPAPSTRPRRPLWRSCPGTISLEACSSQIDNQKSKSQ